MAAQLLRRSASYGPAPQNADSAINVLLDVVQDQSGKRYTMDHYATRYPTNVVDIADFLVRLARESRAPRLARSVLTPSLRLHAAAPAHRALLGRRAVHKIRDLLGVCTDPRAAAWTYHAGRGGTDRCWCDDAAARLPVGLHGDGGAGDRRWHGAHRIRGMVDRALEGCFKCTPMNLANYF